jgi:ankyrin repeat protein
MIGRRLGWLCFLAAVTNFSVAQTNRDSRKSAPPETPAAGSDTIEPQLPQARLLVDGNALEPTRTRPRYRSNHAAGDFRLEVDGPHVELCKDADSKPLWSVESDDGKHLQWLASTAGMAYFLGYSVDQQGHFDRYCEPPQIRSLDLGKHRWGERLVAASAEQADQKPGGVISALVDDQHLFVLATIVEGKPADNQPHVTAYVVSCFGHNRTKPLWTRSFAAAEPRPYTGGHLWAARVPRYASSNLQHLSWLGDRLLVCAEAKQPILCLNPDTGTDLWSCERVWEYQRGFIGPSVWQHYIERFGMDPFFEPEGEKRSSEREQFNKQFNCSIIGGPIAVPLAAGPNNDTHSIFVAVAREPQRVFGGYLADCVVYELSGKGKPVSMVNLPQSVNGSQFQVVKGGVVWQGANDSLMRLRLSERSGFFAMGPGGPDALTRIDWFRQAADEGDNSEQRAWLVTDRVGAPIAFNRTHAVRLPAGGFVATKTDRVFQFPISVVDLRSTVERPMMLRMPFRDELAAPATNYSLTDLPDGKKGYHAVGPYRLAITQLALHGTRLEIVLGMHERATSVEFDLGSLVADEPTERPLSRTDPWIKSLRDSKDGSDKEAALSQVARDGDTRRIRALLEAGANPRTKSEGGWTALMTAACYGTADAVDLLIKAGSDVNACDSNCGGQSVLMWAARSGREAKRKVRSLLAAGANRTYTCGGHDVLMSATSNEDVAVVELLLGEGLDVNHCANDGTSVLMDAAHGGSATMLSVLLKAGAKVNHVDQQGRTALMCAAEGFASPEAIRVLLDAGADPKHADHEGRTALDLCRRSNSVGHQQRASLLEAAMTQKSKP